MPHFIMDTKLIMVVKGVQETIEQYGSSDGFVTNKIKNFKIRTDQQKIWITTTFPAKHLSQTTKPSIFRKIRI